MGEERELLPKRGSEASPFFNKTNTDNQNQRNHQRLRQRAGCGGGALQGGGGPVRAILIQYLSNKYCSNSTRNDGKKTQRSTMDVIHVINLHGAARWCALASRKCAAAAARRRWEVHDENTLRRLQVRLQ